MSESHVWRSDMYEGVPRIQIACTKIPFRLPFRGVLPFVSHVHLEKCYIRHNSTNIGFKNTFLVYTHYRLYPFRSPASRIMTWNMTFCSYKRYIGTFQVDIHLRSAYVMHFITIHLKSSTHWRGIRSFVRLFRARSMYSRRVYYIRTANRHRHTCGTTFTSYCEALWVSQCVCVRVSGSVSVFSARSIYSRLVYYICTYFIHLILMCCEYHNVCAYVCLCPCLCLCLCLYLCLCPCLCLCLCTCVYVYMYTLTHTINVHSNIQHIHRTTTHCIHCVRD